MQRRGLSTWGWLTLALAVALASPTWSRPPTRAARALHGVTSSTQGTTAWVSSLDDDDTAALDWVARSSRTPRELIDSQSRAVSREPVRMASKGPGPTIVAHRKVPAQADDGSDPDCPASLH